MVSKVTNMVLNSDNAVRIAERVMKDRNMSIRRSFSPVISEHTINIDPKSRIKLTLTDTEFNYSGERLFRNNWKEMIRYKYNDTSEKVEERFLQFVTDIFRIKK